MRPSWKFAACASCFGVVIFILYSCIYIQGHQFKPTCRADTLDAKSPYICSHQARPDVSFKGVPNIQQYHQLVTAGIGCFDLDVQTSKDGQLFVGHPTMVSESLKGANAEETAADDLDLAKVPRLKVCA
jgi:hypothetical protein